MSAYYGFTSRVRLAALAGAALVVLIAVAVAIARSMLFAAHQTDWPEMNLHVFGSGVQCDNGGGPQNSANAGEAAALGDTDVCFVPLSGEFTVAVAVVVPPQAGMTPPVAILTQTPPPIATPTVGATTPTPTYRDTATATPLAFSGYVLAQSFLDFANYQPARGEDGFGPYTCADGLDNGAVQTPSPPVPTPFVFTPTHTPTRTPTPSDGADWRDGGGDCISTSLAVPATPAATREFVWPDCALDTGLRSLNVILGGRGHSCITSLLPPQPKSNYVGNIVQATFTCSAATSFTPLRLAPFRDPFADTSGAAFALYNAGAVSDQILVPFVDDVGIACQSGTGPTATPTEHPPTNTPSLTSGPTATRTPTATPCVKGGCLLYTPTLTRTPTLCASCDTPTPTATPTSTSVTPSPMPTATRTSTPTVTPCSVSGNTDTDCDLMPDAYEFAHFCLRPYQTDANADPDKDGKLNILEMAKGSNPCSGDTDGDSLDDGEDPCQLLPEDFDGYQDADGCPDTDNDFDGIYDIDDECPNVPEDKDAYIDEDGCQEPDNDIDGFKDHTDDCPGTDYTVGPDGIPDSGDEPFGAGGRRIKTREDYDGVLDTDGCYDAPGDDYDGDGLIDDTEVFVFATDAADPDTDEDGCKDGREVGTNAMSGGLRNPLNRWDFFDAAGPGGGPPDKRVDLNNDILGVLMRYSASPTLPYDARYDRGLAIGPYPWSRSGPDGRIDLANDILAVIGQYLHDCR